MHRRKENIMPHITKFRGPNGSTLYFDASTTGPGRWKAASNDDTVTLAVDPRIIGDEATRTERVEFGFKIGWTTFGDQKPDIAAAYGYKLAKVAADAEYFAGIIARTDAVFAPDRARELLNQADGEPDLLRHIMDWDDVADALRVIADQD